MRRGSRRAVRRAAGVRAGHVPPNFAALSRRQPRRDNRGPTDIEAGTTRAALPQFAVRHVWNVAMRKFLLVARHRKVARAPWRTARWGARPRAAGGMYLG